jgi:putative heme-binding domain-containing protein
MRTGCLWLLMFLSASSLLAQSDELRKAKDAKIVETLLRLPGFDLNAKPEAKAAVLRHLETLVGDEKYTELVEKLHLVEAAPGLLKQTLAHPDSNLGVQCARLLIEFNQAKLLQDVIAGKDDKLAENALLAVGLVANPKSVAWLEPVVLATDRSVAVRTAAVRALGKMPAGEEVLLKKVVAGELPADLKFAAANVLLNSVQEKIKTEAAKHLTLPATADAQPLPPLAELVKRTGNSEAGKVLFETKGTCVKCHIVNGQGKEVGPNLSEIGSKLSREALFVSILDPSAGVSHNFETSTVVTENGQQVTGIIVSDTAESIVVKTADAILRTIPRSEVEEVIKLKTSLMPNDLQRLLTGQELIDIVEYLTILKKK